MSVLHEVMLGLGSNIGDRAAYIQAAIDALCTPPLSGLSPVIVQAQCSRMYESPALLPDAAKKDWDMPFVNCVLRGNTTSGPKELLAHVKSIEKTIGREVRGHWAPREIDIDILAFDNQVLHDKSLQIPHPEINERDFVLIPLAEIAPDWVNPDRAKNPAGQTAIQLLIESHFALPFYRDSEARNS